MSRESRGFLGTFFGGLWSGINFTRRLVINLVFFLILFAVLAALLAGRPAKLQERTALVLNPSGMLVEQFSADPGQVALARLLGQELQETRLRDLIDAIDSAAEDARIERLVIYPDKMTGAGLASLREVAAALTRFRASGKEIVAFSDGMTQGQYYLAAQADEIYLHPEGVVLLTGYGSYRSYFAEMLEKLSVQVHLFRVGEFKSAGEPYIRSNASEEALEADLYWLGSLWDDYLADVAAARGLEPEQLAAGIEALPERLRAQNGDLAELALSEQLVTSLKTRDQVRDLLLERGVADKDGHTFRQVSLNGYLGALSRERAGDAVRRAKSPQVAIVVAQGVITGGEQPQGTVGGDSTSRLIREARQDELVKALVLRVDSPGGGVFPSEQIRREVELTLAAGKPVVVSMGDVAASGGYWISMDADEIIADAATITGSIGIFGLIPTFPESLARLGIYTDGVGTTSLAGAFDPTRPLDPRVADIIQTVIDRGYDNFIGKVAEARDTPVDAIDEVARGRVWSGRQALDRGLIDRLGGLEDAVASAAERAGISDDYVTRYVEREPSAFEQFLLQLGGSSIGARVGTALGVGGRFSWLLETRLGREALQGLQLIDEAQRSNTVYQAAYCFCSVK